MYTAAWTGAESIVFTALQSIVTLILILLMVSTYTLYLSKSRYFKPVAVLFIICISPFLLGKLLVYNIQIENEQDIVVNDPFRVNTIVKNPYPIPVWYEGYKSMVLTAYPVGEPDPLLIASDAAGMLTGRGILMPFGSKIVGTRTFRHNEPGTLEILLILEDQVGTMEKKKTAEVTADSVIIEEITLNRNSLRIPYLNFYLINKDTRNITGLNVELNGAVLPWSFRISQDNKVKPQDGCGETVFTAWYDPDIRNFTGFYPQGGKMYDVRFLVQYEDGLVRTRSFFVIAENHGNIETLVTFDHVSFTDDSLLLFDDAGRLSLSLKNTWYTNEPQNIKYIDLYLNGTQLMNADVYIPVGSYWAVSTDIPWKPDPNMRYNVTLVASSRLETSRQSKIISCETLIKEP